MEINNFDSFRAGSYPISVDVIKISHHNDSGVIAKVFLDKETENNYVQIRKHNKGNFVFIATFRYSDVKLTEYYEDSTILFDSRTTLKVDEVK